MRLVLDGLTFPEGPRWRDGQLWFSDLEWGRDGGGRVLRIDRGGAVHTVVPHAPGGPPSGLGWLPDGRLLMVATNGRTLQARAADGSLTEHADLSGLASYGCNDMVVDAAGRAYVGSCDLRGMPAPATSELIVVQPDGRASVADPAMRFPNGSVITPDGHTLIVAETYGECLTAFTITAEGTLTGKRIWAAMPGTFPDGICLDAEGAVWFADARGRACLRVVEGGTVTDRVETEMSCFACTLGGDDGRTLFLLTSILPTRGVPRADRPGRIYAHEVAIPAGGPP